jgi:DNA-directed RNA polymerase specialized sigma24 family protein
MYALKSGLESPRTHMSSPPTKSREQAEAHVQALCQSGALEQAVTLALRTYGPEVLGTIHATVRQPSDADEIFSLFCEAVWKGLASFEWRCSLRTWSYVLARRAWLGFQAQTQRDHSRRSALLDSAIRSLVAMGRASTGNQVRTQRQELVERLRQQLSHDEQLLLTLRVDKQMDWADIARIFEPEAEDLARVSAALRKRFQRLKEHLRAQVPATSP